MMQDKGPGPGPEAPAETYLNGLDKRIAALDEGLWNKLLLAGGILLGLVGALCLFYLGGTETFGSVGLVLAVVVMLLVPNILQRNITRSLLRGRTVSLIAFGAVLLLQLALHLLGD